MHPFPKKRNKICRVLTQIKGKLFYHNVPAKRRSSIYCSLFSGSYALNVSSNGAGEDLGGGCKGCPHPPPPPPDPPWDDLLPSNSNGILRKKKKMWFIGYGWIRSCRGLKIRLSQVKTNLRYITYITYISQVGCFMPFLFGDVSLPLYRGWSSRFLLSSLINIFIIIFIDMHRRFDDKFNYAPFKTSCGVNLNQNTTP